MDGTHWARLETAVNCRLRRGAWYRILELTVGEAKLDVNRQELPVPRRSVKIVSTPPQFWSVVSRPRDARTLPVLWGDKYAVCPACRNRAQLKGAPHSMRCPRCERTFRVGWEDCFVGAT